jgi:hypothetical protein
LLKPVYKEFIKDYVMALINKFMMFITHIHRSGISAKFGKNYGIGKFAKSIGNMDFQSNYKEFLALRWSKYENA